MKKTILIIAKMSGIRPGHGNWARLTELIKELRSFGFFVVLLTKSFPDPAVEKIRKMVDDLLIVESISFSIKRLIKKYSPIAVIAEYVIYAHYLDSVKKGILKLIDTHDVFYMQNDLKDQNGITSYIRFTKKQESALLNKADVLIAIQKNEAKIIENMTPGKKVICAGHYPGFDPVRLSGSKKDVLMHIGSDNQLNIHSINKFLTSTWPAIKKENSEALLHLYGALVNHCPDDIAGVCKKGFIEDLKTAYRDATVVINPALIGTGLKIKTVEALCYGKALVTTSFGAEGLEDGIGKAFIVEDDMQKFAFAVLKLLKDDEYRKSLEYNAHEFAKKEFTKENAFGELVDILNSVDN
jgi:glycosyltransferase involved in cell wall biosynthesis